MSRTLLLTYKKTPPGLSDGQDSVINADSIGNLKANVQSLQAGEDLFNDVTKVEQRGIYFSITTATTTTVKSGQGFIYNLLVVGGTLGTVTVYDNTAASGTIIVPAVTPVANGILISNVSFYTGFTIVTAAATIITGSYR